MRKSLILFLCLALTTSFIYAQVNEEDPFGIEKFEVEKTKTKIIVPKEQHCVDINAKVTIEYNPAYDEARIYYETLYVTYAKDEAMNTVLAVLQDFTKEHKYYHYNYLKDDREKYFKDDKGQRKAQYSSYVKFSR